MYSNYENLNVLIKVQVEFISTNLNREMSLRLIFSRGSCCVVFLGSDVANRTLALDENYDRHAR